MERGKIMSKVIELSDEEVSCLETGLHYLSMYDKDFSYSDYINDLIAKINGNKVYVGGKI